MRALPGYNDGSCTKKRKINEWNHHQDSGIVAQNMNQPRRIGLDINIGKGSAGKYPVTILDSASGAANGEFAMPWSNDELNDTLARMNSFQTTDEDLRKFGDQLFSALFKDEVKAKYDASYGASISSSEPLRIRMRLQDPDLQRLPWELLWDKTFGNFLLASDRIQLSRHLPAPHPAKATSLAKPISALLICADPRHDRPPLEELEPERNSIVQALQQVGNVDMLQPPTLAELERRLGKQTFDLIHFFGHGEFRAGKGYLIFEDEERFANPVDGSTLATVIQGKDSAIQLVVLNTCESGRPAQLAKNKSIDNYVSGVAESLVLAGIPAIIAMQFRIPDISARRFTERFYLTLAEQLVNNEVDIEDCVGKARVAVQANAGHDFVDWVAPVVFLRSTLNGQAMRKGSYTRAGRRRGAGNSDALDIIVGEDFIQVTRSQKTLVLQSPSKYDVIVETTLEGLLHIYEIETSDNKSDEE